VKKSKAAKPHPTSIVIPPDVLADIDRIREKEQRMRHPMMIILLRKGIEAWGGT
jgi:hypothetical protein